MAQLEMTDKRQLMVFGDNLLDDLDLTARKAVCYTMPEPWEMAPEPFRRQIDFKHDVVNTDEATLNQVAESVPESVGVCVGLGGGSSLDVAKYVAWRRSLPVILIPSILSVDACVTETAAVRREGRVRYVGKIVPENIIIDFAFLKKAPKRFNRAGAADILSIFTALFDWQLAHERTGESYDPNIAQEARALLSSLDEQAEEVGDVSSEGLRFLAEAFAIEDAFCTRFGASRPEEGSEHYFAYNLEFITKRSFLHGELVGLGIVVMASLQGRDINWVIDLLGRLRIDFRLSHLGMRPEELKECLRTLADYCQHEGLPYSIVQELASSGQDLSRLPIVTNEREGILGYVA